MGRLAEDPPPDVVRTAAECCLRPVEDSNATRCGPALLGNPSVGLGAPVSWGKEGERGRLGFLARPGR